MTSSSTLALPNAPLNILAIDGGAMMGVVPARILQYLEGKISNTSLYNGNTTGPVATPPSPFEIDSLTPLNKQICQAFDLIVGTSTGGLIAFALAVPPGIKGTQDSGLPTEPMSAQAVLDFYFAQSENIFPPNPPDTMLTTKTPLFENGGLINAISSVFGAPAGVVSSKNESPAAPVGTLRHATDAVVPVLVTSFNNNPQFTTQPKATICPTLDNSSTQQGPLLIGAVGPAPDNQANWIPSSQANLTTDANSVADLSVLQGALMTSAFPMLLPPVPFNLDFVNNPDSVNNYFLDGGIYAGNPAMAVLMWAMANKLEIGTLVSVGCGSYSPPSDVSTNYSDVANWGSGTSELIYSYVNSISPGLVNLLPQPNPGWLGSENYTSVTNGEYSALLHAMQTGPSQFNDAFISAILANQQSQGQFFRLQPDLGSLKANPAWASDPSVLASWVNETDNWMTTQANGASGTTLLNAVVTQVNSVLQGRNG